MPRAAMRVANSVVRSVVAPAAGMLKDVEAATARRIMAAIRRACCVWRLAPRTRLLICAATQGSLPARVVSFSSHMPTSPEGSVPAAGAPS